VTNHAEAVKIEFQKGSVAYAELVEFFYVSLLMTASRFS
jgi:peptide methionine sulfoxide reductase MsrA